MFKKIKTKAIFVKPIGDVYEKIDEKKVKLDDDIIQYNNKTYPLTKDMIFYVNKKTKYIFIDIDNDKIIKMEGKSIGINAKFLDRFMSTGKLGLIGQLLGAIREDMRNKSKFGEYKPIVWILLGAVLGFLAGGGGGIL